MVEPLAPSSTRGTRRATAPPPGAAPWSTVEHPERDPLRDAPPRPAEVPRHDAPPATPGLFWILAAAGVGVLLLAHLIRFLAVLDDLPDEQVAPGLFGVIGVMLLCTGLALAALLQRGLSVAARIALLLGSAYFAMMAAGWLSFVGFSPF